FVGSLFPVADCESVFWNAACGLFTGLTRVRRFQQVPFNYSATLWC
ncbi:hypothetical protein SOVF_083470 isoform B, partial [Spinacia oleracea]